MFLDYVLSAFHIEILTLQGLRDAYLVEIHVLVFFFLAKQPDVFIRRCARLRIAKCVRKSLGVRMCAQVIVCAQLCVGAQRK